MSTAMGATLVEMKAGKMNTQAVGTGGKLKVEPDMRRGKLSLVKNTDNTVRLLWTDRTTGTLEDDMLVFPGEQTFEKVETGKEKDRVYLLQFKSQATRRFFFWMQDGDDKKDDVDCATLSKLLTDAAAVAAARAIGATTGGAGASGAAGGATAAQQRSLVEMLQMGGAGGGAGGAVDPALMSNLNSILQNMGLPLPEESASPAVAAPATPASTAATPAADATATTPAATAESKDASEDTAAATPTPVAPTPATDASPAVAAAAPAMTSGGSLTAEALQNALADASNALRAMNVGSQAPTPGLHHIFNADEASSLLYEYNEQVQQELTALLPDGLQTTEELAQTMRSAPLRQAMGALSSALNSDNFNTIMATFGLDPSAGAEALNRGDGVGAFLAALQHQVKQGEDKSAQDDDDNMYD